MKLKHKTKVKFNPPRNPDIFNPLSCRTRARSYIASAQDEIRLALVELDRCDANLDMRTGMECRLITSAREALRCAHRECCASYRNESVKQIGERVEREAKEKEQEEAVKKEAEEKANQDKDTVNANELV